MLNASAIIQTFQGSLSSGVDNIFLCSREGVLLCAATRETDNLKPVAAIASTIWGDYEVHLPVADEEMQIDLGVMILEGTNGKIVASHVNSLCLCVMGRGNIGKLMETLNMLKTSIAPSLETLPIEVNE